MEVSFVRRRGHRDRVYVTRPDGSTTGWEFPTYGDRLPHDLCHLVVEDALGIANGFWGLVAQGTEVKVIDRQATLVRHGKPLIEQAGVDFSDLVMAEEAVAILGHAGLRGEPVGALTVLHLGSTATDPPDIDGLSAALGFSLPPNTTSELIESTLHRLADLGEQWRSLEDGVAIKLVFRGKSD